MVKPSDKDIAAAPAARGVRKVSPEKSAAQSGGGSGRKTPKMARRTGGAGGAGGAGGGGSGKGGSSAFGIKIKGQSFGCDTCVLTLEQ